MLSNAPAKRPSSVAGIAKAYEDFLDMLVVDSADAKAADGLRNEELRVVCTNTLMRSADDKVNLARTILDASLHAQQEGEK